MKHKNPIISYLAQHNSFIDKIKQKYNKEDDPTKFEDYLKPIYLEMLKCLYSIFKRKHFSKDDMNNLLQRTCALQVFENKIVDNFFKSNEDRKSPVKKFEQDKLRRYKFLEEIILEYNGRRQLYFSEGALNEDQIKKKLIRDCMKYIIHIINKRITYIYQIKSKLNSIDIKEDVKKIRGLGRKNKFIKSLYKMIDKCCINVIHLTLKESLPIVHDVRMVLNKVLTSGATDDINSLLQVTDDIDEVDTETLQDDSFLYTWFLVMFSMLRMKHSSDANDERDRITQEYLKMANAKPNEYTNDKNRTKFLQNRIKKIHENIENYKLKYEWERLKKNRTIHKIYRKKVRDDTEEYKTLFEAASMSFIPRILKARLDVRLLFKLLGETDVDPADPKFHEKIQMEKEEKEQEEAERGKRDKKKKDEVIDHIRILRETHRHCSDKAFDLYAGIDAILANLMAQTNRSVYLQKDIKVAMKNYIRETRKGESLAPYKLAARKRLIYTIQNRRNLPDELRVAMKKEIRCLRRMSRYRRRFRRTFKRFRKHHAGEELNKFPPLTEVVWKRWEKRAYKKRMKLPYRPKGKLLPTFQFLYVQEPKSKRLKTRAQKHKEQRVSNQTKGERRNENEEEPSEKEDTKDEYELNTKEARLWTGNYYSRIKEEYQKKHRLHTKREKPNSHKSTNMDKRTALQMPMAKEKPDFCHNGKDLLESKEEYEFKRYLQQRKEEQRFCNKHDFNRQMECENQVAETFLTEDIERIKKRRTLKRIKDLLNEESLKAKIIKDDLSEEDF